MANPQIKSGKLPRKLGLDKQLFNKLHKDEGDGQLSGGSYAGWEGVETVG